MLETVFNVIAVILTFGFACVESRRHAQHMSKAIKRFARGNRHCVLFWLKVLAMSLILLTALGPVMYYGEKAFKAVTVHKIENLKEVVSNSEQRLSECIAPNTNLFSEARQ